MKLSAIILSGMFLFLFFHQVTAQTEKQLTPKEIKQSTIVTQPITLNKGFYRVRSVYYYGYSNVIFDFNGHRTSVGSYFNKDWSVSSSFSYGLSDRFELGVDIPFRLIKNIAVNHYEMPFNDFYYRSAYDVSGSGLSDIQLRGDFQLIPEQKGTGLVAFLGLTLPTGRKNPKNVVSEIEYSMPIGDGYVAADIGAYFRKVIFPSSYYFNVDYQLSFVGTKQFDPYTEEARFKESNRIMFLFTYRTHLNEWLALDNSMSYFVLSKSWVEGASSYLTRDYTMYGISLMPGLSFQIKQLRFNQGLSVPIVGKVGSADVSYYLIVGYVF